MARYDIYHNPGGGYVLDVQADILDELKTRIVIPLLSIASAPKPATRLNPTFEINGERYILVTQYMAAIPTSTLREPVTSLSSQHDLITAALDMAFHGF